MWTEFHDMHSGGSQKLDWARIFIEAPKEEAKIIFFNRFDRNPERVTCTCCGDDYSISEHETLQQATGYIRCCMWEKDSSKDGGSYVEKPSEDCEKYPTIRKFISFDEFLKKKEFRDFGDDHAKVLIIKAKSIKPQERKGEVPAQGYVWVD